MEPNKLDRPIGLMRSELEILDGLLRRPDTHHVLEIGMAFGSSAEAILKTLRDSGGGHLTSIDPFQLVPEPEGFGGGGVARVREVGLGHMHELLARPDYLALPELVSAGRKFDFIFIDGYHAIDYVFLDAFYADLLLKPGGIMAFHDSYAPAVLKVCRFVEANGRYQRLGPPPSLRHKSVSRRIARRLYYAGTGRGRQFRERREVWKSLAAFVKERDGQTPEFDAPGL